MQIIFLVIIKEKDKILNLLSKCVFIIMLNLLFCFVTTIYYFFCYWFTFFFEDATFNVVRFVVCINLSINWAFSIHAFDTLEVLSVNLNHYNKSHNIQRKSSISNFSTQIITFLIFVFKFSYQISHYTQEMQRSRNIKKTNKKGKINSKSRVIKCL